MSCRSMRVLRYALQSKRACSLMRSRAGGPMTRRGQTTTFQERVEITERAAAGQTDTAIAVALGCSAATVRKWRRLGQRHGPNGLASRMGRPASGTLSTVPLAVRDKLLCL